MLIRKGMFIVDRYEIIDKVGSGGMSDVYKALDHKLNRYVAVKVLKDEFSEDKSFVSKFKVEAQSAAGLAHPNIVNVYDVGEENGIYFIVMELVEGITLKKYIEKKGKLPVKEAVSIAIQIAQGIEAAHNNHIIHRDIKPQNVIISREGKVKVTDFGIARAASSNTINSNAMGSVHYISPEQARGGYIDEKSDIYSLGISLYEMLTGKVPFEGDSTVTIALQHINEELPSPKHEVPDLPISVEKIIEKCTQKKAERRYLKVSALIADLKKSLIAPDEDFVVIASVPNNDATIMITDEEVSQIRKGGTSTIGAVAGNNNDSEENEEDWEDEADDIDDDIDAANPKFDKLVTIGTIVASIVILIVFILVIIQVLKGCDSDGDNPYINETSSSDAFILDSTQTIVPKVIGLDEQEAKNTLNNANLGIRYEYKNDNTVPKGEVISQSMAEGTIADKGETVIVTISSGSLKFDIPSVEGLTREEALELLQSEEYGLDVKVIYEVNEEIEAEKCIRTSPTSPTQLTYGAHVDLYVSQGVDTAPVEIPAVEGKVYEVAKQELEALGLVVSVQEINHDTIVAGKVITADYMAGTSVPKGTTVTLTVSLGKKQDEPTTPKPTEPQTEMVKRTEVTIKGFSDANFKDMPMMSVPVEGGAEGETQMLQVTAGTLEASLIVEHDGKTTNMPVTDKIISQYQPGYSQAKIKMELEELGVTDVTFMVTLIPLDADGNEMDPVVVYTEEKCNTEEIEVSVEVR